jgi:hypothetical protein
MSFDWLNRQMLKYGYACGRRQRFRGILAVGSGIAKFAGWTLQLTSQNSNVPWSFERHGYPIACTT